MVKQILIAALVAFSPFAAAQLNGLPDCALQPAVSFLGNSKCGLTGFQCACSDADLLSSLNVVVGSACTAPADISAGYAAASSICAPYGGPAISITSTPGAAAVAAATSPASSSAPVTSAASAASAASTTSVATAPYSAGNSSTAANSSGLASGNRTGAAGAPIVTGAATKNGVATMRDAGALAGIVAFLGAAMVL